jgi:hypothetical protein
MQGKERFLNSSNKEIEKVLENEKRYHDYKIEHYKRFWHSLRYNPFIILGLLLFIILIVVFGYYHDWHWKEVINK